MLGVLLSTASQQARAQVHLRDDYVKQFKAGAVVLADGRKLEGAVTLNRAKSIVLVRTPSDTVYNIPAAVIEGIAVEEEPRPSEEGYVTPVRVYRPYYVIHNRKPVSKTRIFFEQLSDGPTYLLRRQQPATQPTFAGSPYSYSPYSYNQGSFSNEGAATTIQDVFYLSIGSDNILALRDPKRDVLAFFRQQAPQIKQYARENKLHYTNARELASIVNYANSLQKAKL
jgi:hypothetical protein